MEIVIGVLVVLVLFPLIPDLRVFAKNIMKDINGEQTGGKK